MLKFSNEAILYFAVFLYFVANYISGLLPAGQLLVVVSLALTALIYVNKYGTIIKLKTWSFLCYIACFTLFCIASRLWAEDPNLAITKINSLVFIFIGMSVISTTLYENRDIDKLLKTIMWGGYFVISFVVVKYGISGFIQLMSSDSRISNELMNANTLGMCAAYSIVITLYYVIYDHFKVQDVIMFPATIIIAVSGSRKAIIVVILGFMGLLILKNLKSQNFFKTMRKIVWAMTITLLLVIILSRLPLFSVLNERIIKLFDLFFGEATRSSNDAWIRLAYTRLGLSLFQQNPLLGIGIANATIYTDLYYGHNHYLHNNFVELLACGGLVGFTIYYSIYVGLLKNFWKFRRIRNREYDICLLLLVLHLIMDYGAVSYYGKATYLFLFLYWMEIEKLKVQQKKMRVIGNTT